jgi:hypothetical protein
MARPGGFTRPLEHTNKQINKLIIKKAWAGEFPKWERVNREEGAKISGVVVAPNRIEEK